MKQTERYESVTYQYDSVDEMRVHRATMDADHWNVEEWNFEAKIISYFKQHKWNEGEIKAIFSPVSSSPL